MIGFTDAFLGVVHPNPQHANEDDDKDGKAKDGTCYGDEEIIVTTAVVPRNRILSLKAI